MTPQQSVGINIAEGHTLLLDPEHQGGVRCFKIEQGLLKVSLSTTNNQSITLGFLQAGDQLPLEFQRRATMHLEAITPVQLSECNVDAPQPGQHSLNDWTVDLLLIRHLTTAEQGMVCVAFPVHPLPDRRSDRTHQSDRDAELLDSASSSADRNLPRPDRRPEARPATGGAAGKRLKTSVRTGDLDGRRSSTASALTAPRSASASPRRP